VWFVDYIIVTMVGKFPLFQSFDDLGAMVELDSDPTAAPALTDCVGCAATAKRIQYKLSRHSSHLDYTVEDLRGQDVRSTGATFALPMSNWRNIGPHVL
jgi:hypothetical protein